MTTRKLTIAVAIVLAVAVAGCAKAPQDLVDAAKTALAAAESSGAATYAEAQLRAAREAMTAVDSELETQAGKFALFRSYKTAEQLVADATARATEAKSAAEAGKQQAMQEAQDALSAALEAISGAEAKMAEVAACKRKPKGFAADMEAMTGMLEGIRASLPAIESALAGEDYFGARAQADSAADQARTLSTDLDGAKTKMGC